MNEMTSRAIEGATFPVDVLPLAPKSEGEDTIVGPAPIRTLNPAMAGFVPKTKREAKAAAARLFGEASAIPGQPIRRQIGRGSGSDLMGQRTAVRPPLGRARPPIDGLYRNIDRHLNSYRARNRDFLYLHLNDRRKADDTGVVSVMLFAKNDQRQVGARILTFSSQHSRLKHEPDIVSKFNDIGGGVAREIVESNGHAIERLSDRMTRMGWRAEARF